MKFKLPKQFDLLGHTIKVKVVDHVEVEGAVGLCKYYQNELQVQDQINGVPMCADVLGHTFYHEFAHHLLFSAGYPELSNDEKFVDMLGQLLYQYEKTRKFK